MLGSPKISLLLSGVFFALANPAYSSSSEDLLAYVRVEAADLLSIESVEVVKECYAHAIYLKTHLDTLNLPTSSDSTRLSGYDLWRMAAVKNYITSEVADAHLDGMSMSMAYPRNDLEQAGFEVYEKTSLKCQKLWVKAHEEAYEKIISNLDYYKREAEGYSVKLDRLLNDNN